MQCLSSIFCVVYFNLFLFFVVFLVDNILAIYYIIYIVRKGMFHKGCPPNVGGIGELWMIAGIGGHYANKDVILLVGSEGLRNIVKVTGRK